jgi:predicted small lipoprotein YifL
MKKRFIILIIILITLISLTSCGKVMSIDKARTLA